MIKGSPFKAKMVGATALVLLFGSGVVVGLAWDQTATASTPEEVRRDGRSGREERTRRPMIVDRVDLSVVQKATVAGIPIVAAVSAPSSLAIELAREGNVTLLGFVRGDTFNIYTGDHRIVL